MRTTIALLSTLLVACLDPTETSPSCEAVVCAHVPCAPFTTGTWDMRSEAACLDTFACGARPDACEAAMLDLPCWDKGGPSWDDLDAHTRALEVAREACR